MRIFTIIGTLITVVIIGFMAAMYLNTATAPVTNVPRVETPYGTIGQDAPGNAIDTARSIVSVDRNRQQDMQNRLDRLGETTENQ
ncbi:MAG: hypothetical protein LBT23_01840 [Synergistaceae bacterium]|nr:hypothetical protein [Synergistaceae bacterium]